MAKLKVKIEVVEPEITCMTDVMHYPKPGYVHIVLGKMKFTYQCWHIDALQTAVKRLQKYFPGIPVEYSK